EAVEAMRALVPAGIERQRVALEHALEQADHGGATLHDQPSLRSVAAQRMETESFVERTRRRDVLHGEADRKRTQFHAALPVGVEGVNVRPWCAAATLSWRRPCCSANRSRRNDDAVRPI